MEDENSHYKIRELVFDPAHPDPEQANVAALSLTNVDGIVEVQVISTHVLRVSYDLLDITMEQIVDGLSKAGFHLSNKLIYKLKRALYCYTEGTERANLGCPKGHSNCTRKVFIEHYRHREHGCRDHRPDHWRQYL